MDILVFSLILVYVIATVIFFSYARISAQRCKLIKWVRRT